MEETKAIKEVDEEKKDLGGKKRQQEQTHSLAEGGVVLALLDQTQ